jgi:hypothetical protein
MCKELIYLFFFVLVLGLVGSASAGLIAYWSFDEGSGTTAADSSGNNNTGTLYGGPQWVAGMIGGALGFDGTDDYVGTGKILLSNVSAFTLAGWVSAGNPGSSRVGLFGQNDCVEFGFDGGNIGIWTPGGGSAVTEWTFADLTWHHVAVVGDGTSLKIYLDGQQAAVGGATVSTIYGTSTYQMRMGGGGVWDASGNWFSGQIDEVRVYSRALSRPEIGSLAGKTTTYTQELYRLLTPQDPAIDMNSDDTIDLKDYALLVDTWLDKRLWP